MTEKLWMAISKLKAEHHDFFLLLLLFASMRFMALTFEKQGGWLQGTPALDYWFYLRFAELSQRGLYPFVHYWLEYQPVFAWLVIGVYKLSLFIPPFDVNLFSFYMLLGSVCTLADIGNLALIYLIGRRVHGAAVGFRAALIYALLFVPLFVTQGWYDSIPVFLLLASLYLLLADHPRLSALVSGIGFMTKLLPALVLVVSLRTLWRWRDRLAYGLIWAATVGVIASPFLVLNPAMLLASFRASMLRSSWETVWALLENFYGHGDVIDLLGRFTPETAGWQSHPSTLPWLWITAAFALLGGVVYFRRLELGSPHRVLALSAFTVMLFFLYSKGYSPQFAVYILPFIVLLLPNLWGVSLVLLYSVANFLEFPIYTNVILDQSWILLLSVSVRTAIYGVVALEAAAVLYDPLHLYLRKAKSRLAVPAAVGMVMLVAVTGFAVYRDHSSEGAYRSVKAFMEPLSTATQAIVVSSHEELPFVHAQLPGYDYYLLPENWEAHVDQVSQELTQLAETHPQLWIVAGGAPNDEAAFAMLQDRLDKFGVRAGDMRVDGLRLVNIVTPAGAIESVPRRTSVNALFGGQLAAQEIGLNTDVLPSGAPLRLAIQWKVMALIQRDLSVFVHMTLPDGRTWSQSDKILTRNGDPATRWRVGDVVEDVIDLPIPTGTPPIEYRLIAGVYDRQTGERLAIGGSTGGPTSLEAGRVRVARAPITTGERTDFVQLSDFREGLRVRGVELPREVQPGQTFAFDVLWRSTRDHVADLVAVYQLVDDQGHVVARESAVPGDRSYPTSQWISGEVVRDRRALRVSPDARPGDYRLQADLLPAGDAANLTATAGVLPTVSRQTVAIIKLVTRPSP